MHNQPTSAGPRVLPYDLAFVESQLEEQFGAVREEVERQHADSTDPAVFLQQRSVAALLRGVLVESDASVVAQFGPLLFQGYHFWRHGKRVYQLDEAQLRELLGPLETQPDMPFQAPAPAGYLALPRNRLWARIDEDARPEPVDGLFWTMAADDSDDDAELTPARLDVLLVLGLMPGRPGFSIVEVSAPVDGAARNWGSTQARADGLSDFANVLPGGELQGLQALTTAGEVLKLVARAFEQIGRPPDRPTARDDG